MTISPAFCHPMQTQTATQVSFLGSSPETPRYCHRRDGGGRPDGHCWQPAISVRPASSEIVATIEAVAGEQAITVRGEIVEGDVAAYHYYPGSDEAAGWIQCEGLAIADECSR